MSSLTTPYLDRIREHPAVRGVPWRDGQEISQAHVDAGGRAQQKGALLMVTRGEIQRPPCTHCAAGNGRFYQCIALEGFYQGACASCVFPSKGVYCSFRHGQSRGSKGGKREQLDTETHEVAAPNKRKRRSTVKVLENATGSATRLAPAKSLDENAAQSRTQLTQEDLNPIEHLNVVHKRHKNDHHAPSTIIPPIQRLPAPYDGGYSTTSQIYPRPTAAQSQNESSRPKPRSQHESWDTQPASKNGTQVRPASPQDPRRPTAGFAPLSAPTSASAPVQSYESMSSERAAVPVIDTFPKAKQRQIYSVVSGLQGGIDHLDKQLSALKTLLGIPANDASD